MRYDSLMRILTKNYTSDSYYNLLLILSIAFVSLGMYSLLQNKQPLMSHPTVVITKAEKTVSIRLTKAAVLEKKKVVPKKKPVKTKVKSKPKPKVVKKTKPVSVVKKELVALVEEPVVEETVEEQEIVEEVLEEVQVQEEVVVFDVAQKEEFIAGLYKILNQNKRYPKMARRRHLEGVAHIQFTLLKDGSLVHTHLYKSCGHRILDKAALELVTAIVKYKPIPDTVSLAALDLSIPIKYSRK